MKTRTAFVSVLTAAAMSLPLNLSAQVATFTENFDSGTSDWRDAAGGALTFNASGGPDGSSFVSTSFNFAASSDGDTPVLFRAQDEFGSSGGAFEGNWITSGVNEFSVFVRHDLAAPVNFFARFSGPLNFPGTTAVAFAPVFANTWTEITFAIDPLNPAFVTFEGSDFNTIFSNVGHVQIGISVPTGFGGTGASLNIDIDQASVNVVPEPTSLALLGGVSALVLLRRRKQLAATS